jgi:hypothetical protein
VKIDDTARKFIFRSIFFNSLFVGVLLQSVDSQAVMSPEP